MTLLRSTLIAAAMTVASIAPSFAQNIQLELSDRQALMVNAAGKVSKMSVNEAGHRMMMKYARPVKAGTLFGYMSGGTLYMVQDRRMAGGQSLHDMLVHMIQ